MDLGHFSVSLTVKDIARSRAFYETIGFEKVDGDEGQKWLMMQNGDTLVGLFEGMFDDNLLTWNPPDVRAIQARLKEAGYELAREAEGDEGAAHIVLHDPDGNVLMFDQF